MEQLARVPGLRLVGTAQPKVSVQAFTLDGVHPQDIGAMLDLDGIAIRTGHHCAEPLHTRLGLTASARMSLGLYSSREDVDALVQSLTRVARMFS
jgi:cysteine desulfurase/selenocysteine lyase